VKLVVKLSVSLNNDNSRLSTDNYYNKLTINRSLYYYYYYYYYYYRWPAPPITGSLTGTSKPQWGMNDAK